MSERKPLMLGTSATEGAAVRGLGAMGETAGHQGLTLVHFSAQLKHILWDRGACRGCTGVFRRCLGVSGGISVPETAQVELKTGRL